MTNPPSDVAREPSSRRQQGERRSARRNTPARVIATLATGVALCYLGFAAWLWMRAPVVTIDPVAALQQATPQAAEGERAWPEYRAALAWLRTARLAAQADRDQAVELAATLMARPGSPEWSKAAALLEAHAGDMDALRVATSRPIFGYVPTLESTDDASTSDASPSDASTGTASTADNAPHSPQPEPEFPSIAIELPYYQELQGAVALLRIEAFRAAELGQGSRVVDSMVAMLRVGAHAAQVPVLVGSLVQYSMQVSAAQTALDALALNPGAFTDADLQRIGDALADITPESTRIQLAGERLMMQDVLQRVYTDDGAGDGVLLPAKAALIDRMAQPLDAATGEPVPGTPSALWFLAGPYIWATAASRADVRAEWTALLDEAEQQSTRPVWQQQYPREESLMPIFGASGTQRMAYLPIALLAPAVSNAARAASRTRVYAAAVRTHVALERFKRAHGKWPDTLGDLVPTYLPGAPWDEYADASLGYSVENGVPRVTSVGTEELGQIVLTR